jgi:hypothetical protein
MIQARGRRVRSLRWIAGLRVRHTCARRMACRDRGIRQLVEAGARNSRLRAATAVVALAGALAAATALAGPAAAAAPSLGAAPPPVQATDVAGDVGATAASAAAPVVEAVDAVGADVQQTAGPSLAAAEGTLQPATRAVDAATRAVDPARRTVEADLDPVGPAPATTGSGAAVGSPNAGGPPNAVEREPARGRSHAGRGGQVRRHSQPAPSGTTEPPASGVDVPRAGLDVAAAGSDVTATATARALAQDDPALPPTQPTPAAGIVAGSGAAAGLFAGLALLVFSSLLADPGVRRRLRLPAVAWRPPILVFLLERPG